MLKMGGVIPGAADKDVQGAFAILSVVGDDSKYKKRLQALTDLAHEAKNDRIIAEKAQESADTVSRQAQQALVDAGKLHDEALAIKAGAEEAVRNGQADIAYREDRLKADTEAFIQSVEAERAAIAAASAKRTDELDAEELRRNAGYARANEELRDQISKLNDRERALVKRDAVVAEGERINIETAKVLADKERDLMSRLDRLRDIIG